MDCWLFTKPDSLLTELTHGFQGTFAIRHGPKPVSWANGMYAEVNAELLAFFPWELPMSSSLCFFFPLQPGPWKSYTENGRDKKEGTWVPKITCLKEYFPKEKNTHLCDQGVKLFVPSKIFGYICHYKTQKVLQHLKAFLFGANMYDRLPHTTFTYYHNSWS